MLKKTLLLIIIFTTGCGGSSSTISKSNNDEVVTIAPDTSENISIPNNTLVENYKVLLIGNSHVVSNNLSGLIESLIQQGKPLSQVKVERSSGSGYLADKVNDGVTLEKINSENWSHVILQAQKYSQSGSVIYPITAAENWIATVKSKSATPILFPEHPQVDNPLEGQYVHDIHLTIVEEQQSCIAPIGLGWDKVISTLPDLKMHASDGNHAAYAGSYFTSLVFYQVITGELADALPYMENIELSKEIQSQLGQIASQILDENQACDY